MASSQSTQQSLKFAALFGFILVGSIFLGSAVGREDTGTALIAVAVIILASLFVGLGKHVWILVPLFVSWTGRVPILPLSFSLSNLSVGFACSAWVLMLATRKLRSTYRFGTTDIIILVMILMLVPGYYMNPVGLGELRSGSNVGARPYIAVAIALVAYVMLASQQPKLSVVEALPKWSLISAVIIGIGGTIAYFSPSVGIVMYQFYTGFKPNVSELMNPTEVSDTVGRAAFLRPLAYAATAYVGAKIFPVRVISPRQWRYLALLVLATVLALLSGFRTALIAIAFYFIFACWFWKRMAGLMICAAVALGSIMAIIVAQEIRPLPERIQRTLSFLPGSWDQRVADQAEGSTEWRVEMWEIVLEGDSIKNWWVGDGFGFPRSEMEYFLAGSQTGELSPDQLAEFFMITGALHSGPLSAAKFAGVIGFILYVILATVIAYRFVKLWRRVFRYGTSTQLKVTVGFFAIPASYIPIKFVFIFGAYNNDLATLILSAGILRLLETATRDHLQATSRMEDHDKRQLAEAV